MLILTHKIVRDLTLRRTRTALTLLGIVVAVAGLVAVSATARQLTAAQAQLVTAPDTPDLEVRTAPVAPRTVSLLARRLGATIEGQTVRELTFSAGGPWRACLTIGVVAPEAQLRRPTIVAGRLPTAGEIAFDRGVEALATVRLGDLVALRAGADGPFRYLRLVGFTRTPAALDAGILNRATAYLAPVDLAALGGSIDPNQLLVKLPSGGDRAAVTAQLSAVLDARSIPHGPILSADASIVGTRELETLVWLLLAFSLLGLVLGSVLVANGAVATVQHEVGQIGTLKALGGQRGQIVALYLAPAALLGAVGTLGGYAVGLTAGQAIVAYLTGLLGYPRPALAITAREIGLALAVGFGMPILAAAGPTALAARRPVASLLRSYGLTGGPRQPRRRWLRRVAQRWPLATLAAGNALRRRHLAGLTVTLIAVAVAATLAARILSGSVETTVAALYDRYGADAWIAFDRPADAALARIVGREPGVVTAETWGRGTAARATDPVDLWAVPPTTTVYDRQLVAGRWLAVGDRQGVVATTNLADRLGVAVGDELLLDVGRERQPFTLVGLVDDESTYLGSTAPGKLFLNPDALAGLAKNEAFTFLAVVLTRHDPSAVEATLTHLTARFADLNPRPYAAYSDQQSTNRSIAVLVVVLRALVAVLATTGAIGVANTLALGVAERRREVGVARALGARRSQVGILVVGEGLMLGLLGFVLGIAIGLPLALGLVRVTGQVLFRLTFHLSPVDIGAILVATLTACVLAALGPALIAARIRPAEALRYE